jgi:ribosomal protein S18 acetylase RimI-like enzyme
MSAGRELLTAGTVDVRAVDPEHADAVRCLEAYYAELERRAIGHGDRAVRLETNRHLTEAIALYRSAGYSEVPAFNDEPYADHWFEKAL